MTPRLPSLPIARRIFLSLAGNLCIAITFLRWDTVTATDNCDGSVPVSYLGEVRNNGGCGDDFYTLTRTWSATDSCGNTSVCTQTIKVRTLLEDPCFTLDLDMSYDGNSETTTFQWELCAVKDPTCQDLSNIKFLSALRRAVILGSLTSGQASTRSHGCLPVNRDPGQTTAGIT